jgi:aspartate aminotransferase
MRLSKRSAAVAESATLRLSRELSLLRAAGKDVVNLLEGEADLSTPEKIKAATAAALRKDQTRYSNSTGLPELKKLIAAKLKRYNRVPAVADNVLVTNGAKQAVYEALQALCDPGDEVLVPAPYWVTFPEAVRLAGAEPVFVPPLGHQLDLDAIGRAATRRTRAIIINTPNNPTGAVYPEEALRELARLAQKRDFMIISDEAYEDLIYDGRRHVSIASLSRDAANRTITIQTFSKTYSMTGFRVGYLAAAPEVVKAVARVHGHVTGNVCTFAQHGAIAALRLGRSHRDGLRRTFTKRRDLAFQSAVRLFDCIKPRGGFFVFPDIRRLLGKRFKGSEDLADFLLKKAGVAVVPGAACGMEGHLRISFSSSEENIREGFRRMEQAL